MRKIRFIEYQIITVLKSVEAGRTIKDVCREATISEASYYSGKAKYGGIWSSRVGSSAGVWANDGRVVYGRLADGRLVDGSVATQTPGGSTNSLRSGFSIYEQKMSVFYDRSQFKKQHESPR